MADEGSPAESPTIDEPMKPEQPLQPVPPTGNTFCLDKADGMYANLQDSTKFYHCAHSNTYIKTCPETLTFNDKYKRCDWPQ